MPIRHEVMLETPEGNDKHSLKRMKKENKAIKDENVSVMNVICCLFNRHTANRNVDRSTSILLILLCTLGIVTTRS